MKKVPYCWARIQKIDGYNTNSHQNHYLGKLGKGFVAPPHGRSVAPAVTPMRSNSAIRQRVFEFYRKRAFIWYKNISSSIIFSQHHEQIQIF